MDFTLTQPAIFPEGTSVGAYPTTNWPGGQGDHPDGAPVGTAAQTKTVTSGSLAFTGLTEGTTYFAVAQVSGSYRYIRFSVGADVSLTENAVASVAGKTGVVTLAKSDVGLSNVDNTADASKPVSTAQRSALDAKQDASTAATAAALTAGLAGKASTSHKATHAPGGSDALAHPTLTEVASMAGLATWLPTGAIAETIRGRQPAASSQTMVSGTLYLAGGIVIPGGQAVTSISVLGSQMANMTHQWFCLVDTSLNVLATTLDDLTTAWTSSAIKTLQVASALGGATPGTYTPGSDKAVYIGLCVTNTSGTIQYIGTAGGAVAAGLTPIITATSTASLTTPASLGSTAGALTGLSTRAYAYIS